MLKSPAPALLDACSAVWREQRLLCDELETIADSLPENVDRVACMHAARSLPEVLANAHRIEEGALFAALEGLGTQTFDPTPTLNRLRIEHAGDECFAEELSEVLFSWGRNAPSQSPEATGYMLRGFFQALRRHIATEEELAAMVSKNLSARAGVTTH